MIMQNKKRMLICSTLLIGTIAFASITAEAADFVPNLAGRLSSIEEKITNLQGRQPINQSNSNTSAQIEIMSIREEMRSLRGAIEETRFAIDQLQRDIKLNAEHTEYRLKTLEEKGTGGQPVTDAFGDSPTEPTPTDAKSQESAPEPVKEPTPTTTNTTESESESKPITQAQAPAMVEGSDLEARNHYNFAVNLIKEKRFERARDSFTSFIKTYPKNILVGNAHYWQGETFYVQGNYSAAANAFKLGFEHNADGIKAPDNLYKLAKSLLNMEKKQEACIVLTQLQKRYKDRNPEVVGLAAETQKASNCGN
jgi:tol-pal system protein YbgF